MILKDILVMEFCLFLVMFSFRKYVFLILSGLGLMFIVVDIEFLILWNELK